MSEKKKNVIPGGQEPGGGAADGDRQETKGADRESETRIAEIEQRIAELEQERDDMKDKYLRKAAEFENYKRRTEQEFSAMVKYANEQLIVDILPVIDDFERSLHIGTDRREFGPFYKGIELIYQKFKNILESRNVKQIESIGNRFDVDLHDALMQVAKENVEPGTIVEEVEKGYRYNDKVIRHAKVVVAKEPDEDTSVSDETASKESGHRENT
jgi:molecular chaperone GrpE